MTSLLVMTAAIAQTPQESPPLETKPEPQQTPEQAKKEEQEADTQATVSNLAKAVQNPVASLVSVPVQNLTDFNIGPYARDRNTVLQFQPVMLVIGHRNCGAVKATMGAKPVPGQISSLYQYIHPALKAGEIDANLASRENAKCQTQFLGAFSPVLACLVKEVIARRCLL